MNFTGKDYGFKFDAVVHSSFPKQEKEYDLIRELLAMNNRFRFYSNLIETNLDEEEVCLVVRKDFIFMPLCMPMIEHEMGHILEMQNKKRWTKNDLGISFVLDEQKPSVFFTALGRECRVRAIQGRLMGEKIHVVLSKIMNHPIFGDVSNNILPYGRFNKKQDVKEWIADIVFKTYNRYTEDKIRHEWNIRMDHLNNWMETKEQKLAA